MMRTREERHTLYTAEYFTQVANAEHYVRFAKATAERKALEAAAAARRQTREHTRIVREALMLQESYHPEPKTPKVSPKILKAAQAIVRRAYDAAEPLHYEGYTVTMEGDRFSLWTRGRHTADGLEAATYAAVIANRGQWLPRYESEGPEEMPLEEREAPTFFDTIAYIEDVANASVSLDGFFCDKEQDVDGYFADGPEEPTYQGPDD